MKINFTFLLQIGHFCITYYVLNRYIFKSTIKSLQKKAAEDERLEKQLEQKQVLFIKKEQNKQKDLKNFQLYVKEHYSPKKEASLKIESDIAYKRDPKEVKSLTEKIKNLIIKEVPHVR